MTINIKNISNYSRLIEMIVWNYFKFNIKKFFVYEFNSEYLIH